MTGDCSVFDSSRAVCTENIWTSVFKFLRSIVDKAQYLTGQIRELYAGSL